MHTERRAEELLDDRLETLHRRTDLLFAGVMVCQWLFAIMLALTVTPGTWPGAYGSIHETVWTAIALGAALALPPILMVCAWPGTPKTRHVIAVSQALWSGFLIYLVGGRVEAHLHVFCSLAVLAFYRDWRVLVTAVTVVFADHVVRGVVWPESIYGVSEPAEWLWVQHSIWLVLALAFLARSCRHGLNEMRDITRREAELEATHASVETIVAERTQQLEQARAVHATQAAHERRLIDALPVLLVRVDRDWCVTDWNPAAEALLGRSAAEAIGRPLEELQVASGEDLVASLLSGGRDGAGELVDVAFRNAQGRPGWLDLSVRRTEDGLLVIGTDVTERRAMRERVEGSQRLESIGQLAAGIAHEINTPIQYIGDNLRFLEESFGDLAGVLSLVGEQDQALDQGWMTRLHEAADAADLEFVGSEIPKAIEQSLEGIGRVAEIVKAMKEFSHPGVAEMKPVDLNRAITSTIMVARNEWKYVAEVETELEPSLRPVECLPGEITQVVLNMIVNAAHAIADVVGQGGDAKGTIRIATRSEGEQVVITISDTGKGMPPEVQQRAFEPFFTTKEVGKGTGQGLAITHGVIVTKHRGSIALESEVGVGTTFTLRIPFEQPSAEEAVAAAA